MNLNNRMPKKKTTKKKATSSSTSLGLFDHINAIKAIQDPDYFSKLTDEDKKTWDNYMIIKALSYNPDYIFVANEYNDISYGSLKPEVLYKCLIDLIPKRRTFDRFIKGTADQYEPEVIKLVAKHFGISTEESISYLSVFYESTDGKESLRTILEKYGTDPKLIKKANL